MTAKDTASFDRVRAALGHNARTVADIAAATELPTARVYDVLRKLAGAGEATQVGGGRHLRHAQRATGWIKSQVETRPGEKGEHAQPVRGDHAPGRPPGVERR